MNTKNNATKQAAPKTAKTEMAKATMPAKTAKGKATPAKATKTTAKADAKKLSQIEAAIQVLAKAGERMSCKAMVGAMTTQGLWSSPGGAKPDATLYSWLDPARDQHQGQRRPFQEPPDALGWRRVAKMGGVELRRYPVRLCQHVSLP